MEESFLWGYFPVLQSPQAESSVPGEAQQTKNAGAFAPAFVFLLTRLYFGSAERAACGADGDAADAERTFAGNWID